MSPFLHEWKNKQGQQKSLPSGIMPDKKYKMNCVVKKKNHQWILKTDSQNLIRNRILDSESTS